MFEIVFRGIEDSPKMIKSSTKKVEFSEIENIYVNTLKGIELCVLLMIEMVIFIRLQKWKTTSLK